MNKIFLTTVCLMGLAVCQANALMINCSVGGTPTGVNLLNFDDLTIGAVGGTSTGPSGSVTVSFTPDGGVVMDTTGTYAAPYLSGGNGTGFGAPNQANGVDQTIYLTTGMGTVNLNFNVAQSYFGLLWGSVDAYNTLSFYNGNTLVNQVTGSQVLSSPNGDQGFNGTVYANITTDSAFNRVVASSTQYAFEFDNVATRQVPDGGMTLALLGVAMSGLAWVRRKI